MNRQKILNALEQISENVEDPTAVENAIAVIRCEVQKEPFERFAPSLALDPDIPVIDHPALDPEKFLAAKFEAGKQYMVFVEWGSVEAEALQALGSADYELMFVFVHPDGRPVADKFLVVEKGVKIFADSRYVESMDGVTLVDPGNRELRDVVVEAASEATSDLNNQN